MLAAFRLLQSYGTLRVDHTRIRVACWLTFVVAWVSSVRDGAEGGCTILACICRRMTDAGRVVLLLLGGASAAGYLVRETPGSEPDF